MNNVSRNKSLPRRSSLAIALALGLSVSGFAFAQSTTGTIFGNAGSAAGDTVTVSSNNGVVRTVSVNGQGQYTIANLPLGIYTVSLKKDGSVISQHNNITIHVGAGTQVNFYVGGANAQNLGAVQVSANALPAIDVTSVSSSTVITSQQLQKLPVGRSAEAIALLSPGAVAGSSYFGNAVSFGGAGVSENAYYVNGFNTTKPYYNIGGFQLPYGAIAQQQTYTGGYSAKYGRSDGGVINQVGKRGTNEWHFGGQVSWSPESLASGGKSTYYPVLNAPDGYRLDSPERQGKIDRYRGANKSWQTIYSAYAGGPLIQDKLFGFFAIQTEHDQNTSVGTSTAPSSVNKYSENATSTYGKLDWNINANNILELTSLTSDDTTGKGATYNYDYSTYKQGDFLYPSDATVDNAKFLIAKYTSYIGDNATLSVVWGKGSFQDYDRYGSSSKLPAILGVGAQNTDSPHGNTQPRLYDVSPDARIHTRGLRVDFTYQLGNHKLGLGIDNMEFSADHQGKLMSGPGYAWLYGNITELDGDGNPRTGIAPSLGVGMPSGPVLTTSKGVKYVPYAAKYIVQTETNMSTEQKAFYVQDVWNATDNLQLNIGLRNDHFINNNAQNIAFVDEKNQWEPRLGFAWDVNGDSTLKIYGNAGRYYLALPVSVAERAANPSVFTYQYYTYTGIDKNGVPTGLKEVGGVDGAAAPGPVSTNNELGQDKDPHTVTANDLKAQYQDEFILGFDKTLGSKWVYGAKATYRELKTAIDDVCDPTSLANKMKADGYNVDDYLIADPGCRIFNPGQTNHFYVAKKDGSGYANVAMSTADWGFKQGAKRKYYGLDLYLSHPFDGKWSMRVDYLFSRSWGNTEGQVRSDIRQDDVSKTVAWDNSYVMENSYGYLPNDRRHQFKARGMYQITPEWLISGTLSIQSGTPRSCLGYYGTTDTDPAQYASNYHWCAGVPSAPGDAGFTPWTKQLNLGVRYTPAFADHKLAFKLNVFNALNEQKPIQVDPTYEASQGAISSTYGMAQYYEAPRMVRLSVSYDY